MLLQLLFSIRTHCCPIYDYEVSLGVLVRSSGDSQGFSFQPLFVDRQIWNRYLLFLSAFYLVVCTSRDQFKLTRCCVEVT